MNILVWGQHDGCRLSRSTAHAVSAGTRLGEVRVLLVGRDLAEPAGEAARLEGVVEVICAPSRDLLEGSAERLANALVGAVRAIDASHLLTAATPEGRGVLPRACALLDVMQISEVIGIESTDTFVRSIYAGSAIVTVRSSDPIKVATVRVTAFPAAANVETSAPIRELALEFGPMLCEQVARSDAPAGRVELADARIVVSGGRGLGSAEKFALLEPLAERLGAAIGASRAAVDAGYAAPERQVGQTGKIVAPDLYIAVGISGAIQHLAGMKDSKVIVAINNDADAPIFQVADYGIVGDLFDVLPALAQAL
jgi:electron transfer flavoprotein alpha subunit